MLGSFTKKKPACTCWLNCCLNPVLQVSRHRLRQPVHHKQGPGSDGQHWHLHRGEAHAPCGVATKSTACITFHCLSLINPPLFSISNPCAESVCSGYRRGLGGPKECVPSPGHVAGGPHWPPDPAHAQHHPGKLVCFLDLSTCEKSMFDIWKWWYTQLIDLKWYPKFLYSWSRLFYFKN